MTSPRPEPTTDLAGAFSKPGARSAGLRLPTSKRKPAKKATAKTPKKLGEAAPPHETPPKTPSEVREPVQEAAGAAESDAAPSTAPEGRSGGRTSQRRTEGPASRAATPRRGRPPTAITAADHGRLVLVLWTPVSIRARMQAVRQDKGTLYLDQVLDAIEATYDEIGDLVARATGPIQVQGRLFERTAAAPVEGGEQRVQLTIRGVLASQLHVIDELVDQHSAGSRSALVNAALDATLPQLTPR